MTRKRSVFYWQVCIICNRSAHIAILRLIHEGEPLPQLGHITEGLEYLGFHNWSSILAHFTPLRGCGRSARTALRIADVNRCLCKEQLNVFPLGAACFTPLKEICDVQQTGNTQWSYNVLPSAKKIPREPPCRDGRTRFHVGSAHRLIWMPTGFA